ncbi:AAA family ATPase [Chitinophaga rhizophila]|uniref:AAA family ATPase n=1 Tax=Chitinophaga rhizophila TaxID=2866212 RepID=A0ABS7GL75_9BACT|nr:AAA family ATPase [Chitinophaga rhizophila]MBW8687407.1 AAA family ATPase [Chitinophaga rhizophila]
MKILAIRFKNLASLEDTNEIDFTKEPLSKAGIFAITGPTGAGKSTLLDALCLALYARTPRYQQAKETGIEVQDLSGNKINQGDVRGILRDGTADGFAAVSFAGIDGNNYRATWSVKRARNRVDGNLQSDNVELFNLTTNTPVPGKKTETLREIERVVGLNFEQFTRSVLLAQGDFTAFLKADKDAKASLLEKLTGTNIYSAISAGIFEHFKQADTELKNLRQQVAGIVSLSADDHLTLTNRQEVLEEKIAAQQTTIAALETAINWYNTLSVLEHSREDAATHHAAAIQALEEAAERIRHFHLVERVQAARGPVEAQKSYEAQLSLKAQSLQDIETRIAQTAELHQQATAALATANAAVHQEQQNAVQYQPAIDRAKALDTLIGERTMQVKQAATAVTAAQNRQDQHMQAYERKEQEIEAVVQTISKSETWQRDNLSRKDIAENITEITHHLSHGARLLLQQQQEQQQQQENTAYIRQVQEQLTALEEKAAAGQTQCAALQARLQEQHTIMQHIPADTLKTTEQDLLLRIREATAASAHWSLLYNNHKEKEHVHGKLAGCQQELAAKTTALRQQQEALLAAQAKKELSDKLLHQARLQIADNVASLREQLVTGEPCPVCGSKTHPFSEENPVAHAILHTLENEYATALSDYNTLFGEIASLTQLCKRLEQDTAELTTTLQERTAATDLLTEKWTSFSLAAASEALSAADKAAWLEEQVRRLQDKQQQVTAQLQTYEVARRTADTLRAQLDEKQQSLAVIADQQKDKQREKTSKEEAQARITQQLEQIAERLRSMTEELAPHFNSPAWADNWMANPQDFDLKIRRFAEQWTQHVKAISDNTQLLREQQSALNEMSKQGPAIAAELTDRINTHKDLQAALQALTSERQTLLHGGSAAGFEQQLKQAIEAAIEQQRTATDTVNARKEDLRAYYASQEQTNTDITQLKDNIARQQLAIQEWIQQYADNYGQHLSAGELVTLLSYPATWIDTERKAITDMQHAIATAKATLVERERQVSQHMQQRTSTHTQEEVTTLYNEAKQLRDELVKEKNNIDFQLLRDAENKSRIGDLQKDIDAKSTIHENWSKLNELIGSADGKKFRQIAQEYTLDILLGYANMHLAMLTSRYKLLRIPGNLGLQVLDKDMGDELRTVFSLSGGESFLVSLALALGLASLSSSKMKVESLFIDEGFGALDPDTLNVAVDALERLHNQGRKVGVISHVQEMTERIPTQIKVIRMANGKSKVEVTGN